MVKAEFIASPSKEDKKFLDLVRNYFRIYCQRSTIHCVRYLHDPLLHGVERLIWVGLLVVSITLCCSFYLLLSERYEAQKLQTVIEDAQYPVFYVHFPAVGVCTDNRINWSKLEAAKAHFLPPNATDELVEVFIKLVTYLETLRFDNFFPSPSELEDTNLEILDYFGIADLARFLTLRCEDIFVPESCYWRQIPFNCCDLFVLEKTELGLCLVFNSQLSSRSREIMKREGSNYYPKHNAKAGQTTGLNFDLLLNDSFKRPGSLATDLVFIMIKKSEEVSSGAFSIAPNTETHIIVRPEMTRTDNSTRNISPEKRNCHFISEYVDFGTSDAPSRYSRSFLLGNCLNNCHESYLVKLCNCTLPIFFLDNEKVMNCTPSSLRCLARHIDIFGYDKHVEEDNFFTATKPGMTCPCLVSCNLLQYYTTTATLPVDRNRVPANLAMKYYKVDVHYQVDIMITYRTSLEFNTIDLIANLGGIFGLCLGASMVSCVELIYAVTVGFPLHLYDNNYYAVIKRNLKAKWAKIMHNEVAHTQVDGDKKKQSKLRHPFQKRANAW